LNEKNYDLGEKDSSDEVKWIKIRNEQFSKRKIILISAISAGIIIFVGIILSLIKIDVSQKSQGIIPSDANNIIITRPVEIFFLNDDGITYQGEIREIPLSGDLTIELKKVMQELINGPASDSLHSALPPTVNIRAVFVDNSERLFIDFSSKLIEDTCKGTACGIATIKTIAKTVAANFPDIYQIQILVAGKPIESLGGYLDISQPFYVIDWL